MTKFMAHTCSSRLIDVCDFFSEYGSFPRAVRQLMRKIYQGSMAAVWDTVDFFLGTKAGWKGPGAWWCTPMAQVRIHDHEYERILQRKESGQIFEGLQNINMEHINFHLEALHGLY